VNGLRRWARRHSASPFPTTLYFGHMAHKAYGARVDIHLKRSATLLICITGLIFYSTFRAARMVHIVIVWLGWSWWHRHFKKFPNRIASLSHLVTADASLVGDLQLVDLALRKRRIESAPSAPKFGDNSRSMG